MQIRHIKSFSDILQRYDDTINLSTSDWAWEFLRRNHRFQSNARSDTSAISGDLTGDAQHVRLARRNRLAETWGLLTFPDVNLPASRTNVFWSDRACPGKVALFGRERATDEPDGLFDLAVQQCKVTHLTDGSGQAHLLLRGSGCVLQVRYRGLSFRSGATETKFDVSLSSVHRAGAETRALAQARRLLGEASAPVWTRRHVLLRNALVALEAHESGLCYRQTAMIFYSEARVSEAWNSGSTAMKAEMARRLAKGRHLRDGGYFELLSSGRARRPGFSPAHTAGHVDGSSANRTFPPARSVRVAATGEPAAGIGDLTNRTRP
ncbi:DNA -binding domain-containing protein [Hyphomonas oceanitis]|uniref:DNA -binding domain-containing protein n=1 Tax=Hyphomonas oceanitis TaxID=81033 RepID=UPI000A0188E4|nr:DUF2285 domain-containing protein [Hyphomonas oceanitis]